MSATMKEAYARDARNSREGYIDSLTDVAWLALKEAGFHIDQNSREYDKLRDAIMDAVR